MPRHTNPRASVAGPIRRWTVLAVVTTVIVAGLVRSALHDPAGGLPTTIVAVSGVIGTLACVTLPGPPGPTPPRRAGKW
jgi:hypothetical protein